MLELHAELLALRQQMIAFEQQQASVLTSVAECYLASARNLLHFIAFHRHNHPGLQARLRRHGLSTLAGCDPHLLASINTLIAVVGTLQGQAKAGRPDPQEPPLAEPADFTAGHALLRRHAELLLGHCPAVVVTLPGEAAEKPDLITDLVMAGMDIARINCAHDGAAVWDSLARQVRHAAQTTGRPCRIVMDLAGPKLRTGPLPSLPGVITARVQRDRYGRLLQLARILAVSAESPTEGSASRSDQAPTADRLVRLPVLQGDWQQLEPGDRLEGRDASQRLRELVVQERTADGLLLLCRQHCRFTSGLVFTQRGGTGRLVVAALPDQPGELVLRVGDRPLLTAGPEGIPCSLPEVLSRLAQGDRVLFDDGRIAARVRAAAVVPGGPVELEITRAKARGSRLRADQGINLPDTPLALPALTNKDRGDLAFISSHADLISYSFVNSEADITSLFEALAQQASSPRGIVLKIETVQAFLNLPRLLLAAMRYPSPLGVMIARGDLAIECGWEALARLQEEILRVCAAAHVPCIWATQVLDSLAHQGLATRAEITDAAMGARAEALMLNKGANILDALHSLRRIMQDSGIQRSDNSIDQKDQLLSCLLYADPGQNLPLSKDLLAIDKNGDQQGDPPC